MDAMVDALGDMKVNKVRMAQCANDYWSQASTVVGYLVKEHGMSYRTGHQVLALMMQDVADRNIPPSKVTPDVLENVVEKYTGRRISVTQQVLDQLFDAMHCVRERKYRAGVAPERVTEHVVAAREQLARDRQFVMKTVAAIEASRNHLDSAFDALRRNHA
jgi:argininosuccinate lyase